MKDFENGDSHVITERPVYHKPKRGKPSKDRRFQKASWLNNAALTSLLQSNNNFQEFLNDFSEWHLSVNSAYVPTTSFAMPLCEKSMTFKTITSVKEVLLTTGKYGPCKFDISACVFKPPRTAAPSVAQSRAPSPPRGGGASSSTREDPESRCQTCIGSPRPYAQMLLPGKIWPSGS